MTIMSCLAVFISGVMVYIVILFIIVPINQAVDSAPARLFSINQTVLVFIGAAITYKLYRIQKHHSLIEHLVKANKKYLADQKDEAEIQEWKRMEEADKQIKMGKLIITALHGMIDVGDPGQ